jgi:menaquinone-dependent protoporphyrinogen oxidase
VVTVTLLVAHGSKHGSTQEVAEVVAERLRQDGREVELRRAADVDDLTPYGGVVLGGSLYVGRWHKDSRHFLSRHRQKLSALPLAIFAIGPKTADQKDIADARGQLDRALGKTPELVPRSVAVFAGVIDPSKLRFPLSRLPASDARDWDAIRAWADELAAT